MEDHIVPTVGLSQSGADRVPGQHDGAVAPGFAEPGFLPFTHDPAADVARGGNNERSRVNEDRVQIRIIIRFAMQQEPTGLRRDTNFVLLFNDESAATFKLFFRQKNLDMATTVASCNWMAISRDSEATFTASFVSPCAL